MMALRGWLVPVWGRLSSLPVFAFSLALARAKAACHNPGVHPWCPVPGEGSEGRNIDFRLEAGGWRSGGLTGTRNEGRGMRGDEPVGADLCVGPFCGCLYGARNEERGARNEGGGTSRGRPACRPVCGGPIGTRGHAWMNVWGLVEVVLRWIGRHLVPLARLDECLGLG